ncbi:hypothetical protein HKO22_03150 [Peptoniphilus sp. AGMB00490]|uniref:Uncharacterized protein n=1 Tax=Peptoniphilus faecalis TaxID=2731255 RepID=A0A848RGA1_9FIRM|nr:hypothetical protein [Peptoniphilus faecalis]NMW84741.1 hypothetical protein [Peptoniphilus faecalis]
MTLDKIIYLSFLAGRVQIIVCCILGVLIATMCVYLIMGASEYGYGDRATYYFKCVRKYAKLSLVTALLFVILPSKWEVLSMNITKGYKVEAVYQMTKDELRDSINYFVNSLEKMESMKND